MELGRLGKCLGRGRSQQPTHLGRQHIAVPRALTEDPKLSGFVGYVEDSGEGRWTVDAAIEEAVPAEVLTSALYARFRSRQDHTFAERILSAMRKGFGGHQEPHA